MVMVTTTMSFPYYICHTTDMDDGDEAVCEQV